MELPPFPILHSAQNKFRGGRQSQFRALDPERTTTNYGMELPKMGKFFDKPPKEKPILRTIRSTERSDQWKSNAEDTIFDGNEIIRNLMSIENLITNNIIESDSSSEESSEFSSNTNINSRSTSPIIVRQSHYSTRSTNLSRLQVQNAKSVRSSFHSVPSSPSSYSSRRDHGQASKNKKNRTVIQLIEEKELEPLSIGEKVKFKINQKWEDAVVVESKKKRRQKDENYKLKFNDSKHKDIWVSRSSPFLKKSKNNHIIENNDIKSQPLKVTAVVYDPRMLDHTCTCSNPKKVHPEHPDRISKLFETIKTKSWFENCDVIPCRPATFEEVTRAHSVEYAEPFFKNERILSDLISNNLIENEKEKKKEILIQKNSGREVRMDQILNPYEEDPSTNRIEIQIEKSNVKTEDIEKERRGEEREEREVDKGKEEIIDKTVDKIELLNPLDQKEENDKTSDIKKLETNKLGFLGANMMPCGGLGIATDTVLNIEHTPLAARLAAAGVIDLANLVVDKKYKNGMAIVRPPGHHACYENAMGFCFFNNVGIAVQQLKEKGGLSRILIVDWDIHHGNGVQNLFYQDPCVLYISLHRYDNGTFYPNTGNINECGEGKGEGFNVNIAWSCGPNVGDDEYLIAFEKIVLPISEQFNPEIIFVCAGFDAADQGPFTHVGGYKVTPHGFSIMTTMLCHIARGGIILALEGGYHLPTLCESASACLSTLVREALETPTKPILSGKGRRTRQLQINEHGRLTPSALATLSPSENALENINQVISTHSRYWNLSPAPITSV